MDSHISREVVELTLRLCESLGDSRSLTVAILVRHGEWDQIAQLDLNPMVYSCPESYAKASASTSFLRKLTDLPTSCDRAAVAARNWVEGEQECFKSNERLCRYLPSFRGMEDTDARLSDFFRRVRKTILSWIGSGPPDLTVGRFGPGATYSDRGRFTTIPDKMSARPTLTSGAMWFLPQLLGNQWGAHCARAGLDPLFVKGNRFSTVPKDARRDRPIGSEPSINIFFQLGLGAELRRRLKNVGIDLEHGQDLHRRLACVASERGHLATLDLSNASDSVSTTLVELLLPHRWWSVLRDLRSPFTLFRGAWVRLEKFSSMGNGYTFELETLIFLALCQEALSSVGIRATPGDGLYVYGDDIIVPVDGVRAVTAVLNFCGFKLNREKSFSEGSFRESCGGDYYQGLPVRGHFLKKTPQKPSDWISLANGLRRLGSNLAATGSSCHLRRPWLFCLDQLPTPVRSCRGPQDLGDIVIHDLENNWNAVWRDGIRYVRCWRPVRHRKVSYGCFHPDVVLACATYGLSWNDGGVNPRGSVTGFGLRLVPFS